MRTRRLGQTGVEVTELGFGGAPIGNLYSVVDDETAFDTIAAAWAGGVRYFDTAPHYGLGLSERRLGAALTGRPRDEYAVSTKVGRLLFSNPVPTGSDLSGGGFDVFDDLMRVRDYSRDGVLRSLESSMQRLALDRIDVVFVHDPEDYLDEAIGAAIPALAELREQGVVRAIGAGMNLVQPLRRIVAETDIDVVMIAGRWTVLDRSAAELLVDCQMRDVSVVAAAPFNSGLLSNDRPADGARFDYVSASPAMVSQARELAAACHDSNVSLPQAALQFPLLHPAVTCVVAGMRTRDEAARDCAWMIEQVPESLWSDLVRVGAST